jgi:O-antigen/teichoic acid export membrane protein
MQLLFLYLLSYNAIIKMQKKFFGSLILIILLNVLVKPFYLFAIDAQVQNAVGSENYGIYFSLLNFSFIFNIMLDIGITNYNTKNIAQHPNTVAKYIGSILGLRLILAFTYFFITIGTALLMGYNDVEMKLLGMLAVNQILAGLILYFRSNFAGLHWFKIDALLSVLDRFLLIIVCSVLLYSSWIQTPFQIEWFVYAQTFTYGLTAVIALLLTLVKIGKIKFKLNGLFNRAILKQSTPYALLILLMMMYTRMDAVMIERILPDGKAQAGIYAQGFRLLDVVNMFAFLIAGLLLPIFSRMIKKKEDIKSVLHSSALLLVGAALLISISCSLFAEPLMDLIYRHHIESSSSVFSWIILSFIPISAGHIFGTLLTANGNMRLLNQMALGGITINLTLNFILIPIYNAQGAAIATLVTQSLTVLVQILLVLKVFRLGVNIKHLSRLGIFTIFLLLFGYTVITFYPNLLGLWLLVSLGIIVMFLLKIIHAKAIFSILRERF